jgi:hypothetical protein
MLSIGTSINIKLAIRYIARFDPISPLFDSVRLVMCLVDFILIFGIDILNLLKLKLLYKEETGKKSGRNQEKPLAVQNGNVCTLKIIFKILF